MQFVHSKESQELLAYVPKFNNLAGLRWATRINQFKTAQERSPYLWKIVEDYHWLEIAINDRLTIQVGTADMPEKNVRIGASLRFVAGIVEIRNRSTQCARNELDGRLRDGLNDDSAFAILYLEVDTALKLMTKSYEVSLADLETAGRHDLDFGVGYQVGELECKSQSIDSRRQIRRKDFYRLVASLESKSMNHDRNGPGLIVVTLEKRLSPNESEITELRDAIVRVLRKGESQITHLHVDRVEWQYYEDCFDKSPPTDQSLLKSNYEEVFGPNLHVAGSMLPNFAHVVMQSERPDDTSKPWLTAMREAANQ